MNAVTVELGTNKQNSSYPTKKVTW